MSNGIVQLKALITVLKKNILLLLLLLLLLLILPFSKLYKNGLFPYGKGQTFGISNKGQHE